MKDGQVVLGNSDGATTAGGVAGEEGGSAAAAAAVTQEQFVIPSQLKQRHLEVDPPPPTCGYHYHTHIVLVERLNIAPNYKL